MQKIGAFGYVLACTHIPVRPHLDHDHPGCRWEQHGPKKYLEPATIISSHEIYTSCCSLQSCHPYRTRRCKYVFLHALDSKSNFTPRHKRGCIVLDFMEILHNIDSPNPRGFQKFNGTPGVEFFISLGFAEPTTHVIQAHFYIR